MRVFLSEDKQLLVLCAHNKRASFDRFLVRVYNYTIMYEETLAPSRHFTARVGGIVGQVYPNHRPNKVHLGEKKNRIPVQQRPNDEYPRSAVHQAQR